MSRILLVMSLVTLTSVAHAQQVGHDACARDVSRLCRSTMNDGEQAVLACLKQHRGRLSKPCEKVLTENGQ
jgi:Cysteine rich repeat